MLRSKDTIGCWIDTSLITFAHTADRWLSASAEISSLSTLSMSTSEISLAFARLPAAVTSNRFFAERRLKKPLICCDVRTSSGWNRRPPAWSLARLMVFETSCGSLFRPLYSPFWNWSVKNSVCFPVKRTFFLIVFRAQPIGRGGKPSLFDCAATWTLVFDCVPPSAWKNILF